MKSNKSPAIRFAILFLVVAIAAGVGYLWWTDAVKPYDSQDKTPVKVTIENGMGIRQAAEELANKKLIRSQPGFFLTIKLLKIDRGIQAGDYTLYRTMNAEQIARSLTVGMKDEWITTIEGWRNEEIAPEVTKAFGIPEQEFLAVAKQGYMFPDTYSVSKDATAGAIAETFLANFHKKVTPQLVAAAAKSGLNEDQMVTLASIVEREGRSDEDRPVIAGILLNRMEKDWPLQTDATLQYALGYQADTKTWWKKELTEDDKKLKSPYNTYINTGLPPGPISNPGLSSINAVAYPKKSDYMFYLHDPKGGVHYGRTLEEHEANIARFLR